MNYTPDYERENCYRCELSEKSGMGAVECALTSRLDWALLTAREYKSRIKL